MSDRSYTKITFYSVPPGADNAIVVILNENGIAVSGWTDGMSLVGEATRIRKDGVRINDGWTDEEVRVGQMAEACKMIVQRFPETVFHASQEAMYDYSGDLIINEPVHGFFHVEVDNTGRVALNYASIAAEAENITLVSALLNKLGKLMGEPNLEEIGKWARGEATTPYVIHEQPQDAIV